MVAMKTIASICVLCVLCRGMIVAAPNAASPVATPGPSTNATAQLPRRIVGIPDYNQTNGFVSAKRAMTETLLAAGLVPVVIPEMDDASADLVLASCDAVLLGGAVPEEDYARRRAFEDRVLTLAEKRGLVVIGICHGCQVINRHYGGTITAVPKGRQLVHKNAALLKQTGMMAEHVAIVPPGDSLMSRTFGEGQVMVNSSHKFRCEKIASGFRVTATSEEDGVVEAIEHETLPIFGFQFHPEYYWRKDPRFMDLIRNAFAPREADAKR
jgi:putative glutamine amidotransferase